MVRTAGVLSLILASAAAAGVAALRAPRRPPADPSVATAREGALQQRLDARVEEDEPCRTARPVRVQELEELDRNGRGQHDEREPGG